MIVDGMDGAEVRDALIHCGVLPPAPKLCGGTTDPVAERALYEKDMRGDEGAPGVGCNFPAPTFEKSES